MGFTKLLIFLVAFLAQVCLNVPQYHLQPHPYPPNYPPPPIQQQLHELPYNLPHKSDYKLPPESPPKPTAQPDCKLPPEPPFIRPIQPDFEQPLPDFKPNREPLNEPPYEPFPPLPPPPPPPHYYLPPIQPDFEQPLPDFIPNREPLNEPPYEPFPPLPPPPPPPHYYLPPIQPDFEQPLPDFKPNREPVNEPPYEPFAPPPPPRPPPHYYLPPLPPPYYEPPNYEPPHDPSPSQYYEFPSPKSHPYEPPNEAAATITCYKAFPPSFSFGVASSSYRIEGAWNQDNKAEDIWDAWTHNNPKVIIDGSNGDYSADAYNKLEEDVEILNNLGVQHYKFSIAWARILTSSGDVNWAGVKHYHQLLTLLKENQIEPIVATYDGDLPQYLQDQGGFLSDQFIDWYLEYAKILFEIFGTKVKYWITFNSPNKICVRGYGDGTYAPGLSNNSGVYEYICACNLLQAHAAAYHLYDDFYRSTQGGKISFAIDTQWYEPNSDCESDREASETKLQFQVGLWAHAIYIGDYPDVVIARVAQLSELQGLCSSRLPRWNRKEIEWIKDTHDFFSLNFDKSVKVIAVPYEDFLTPSYWGDVGVEQIPMYGDLTFGIRKLINWIKFQYHNPSIFISEDGWNDCERNLDDDARVLYIQDILVNIRLAMNQDDARVYGYTYYCYIDTWEDVLGFTDKWGLYDVKFDCHSTPRTPRKSAEYYQFVAKYGCIDDPFPSKQSYLHE